MLSEEDRQVYNALSAGAIDPLPEEPVFLEPKWDTVFARRRGVFTLLELIHAAWREDRTVYIVIEGPLGSGKSSTALVLERAVLGSVAWRRNVSLWGSHFHFDPTRLIWRLYYASRTGIKSPIEILDDAGVFFSRYTRSQKILDLYASVFQTARTATSCIVFTAPSAEYLAKFFRAFTSYVTISLRPVARFVSTYAVLIHAQEISGERYVWRTRHLGEGKVMYRLPDHVFTAYRQLRTSYIEKAIRKKLPIAKKKAGERVGSAGEVLDTEGH